DRLEIVRVERERVDHAVPADHVEWMLTERVARQAFAVFDDDRRRLLLVNESELRWAVQIALAVRSAQAKLAIGVQILRRYRDRTRRFDDEQVGVAFEDDAIRRGARNHHI